MNKFKRLIECILVFICSFIFVFPSNIEAKSPVSSAVAPGINPGDEDLGSIILYDDYTIIFNYRSRLKEVEVKVCNYASCNKLKDVENKIYLSGDSLELDLKEFIKQNYSGQNEYIVKASGTFYSADNVNRTSMAKLETTVTSSFLGESGSGSNEILDSSQNFINFMNKIGIPVVYMALVVTLIIKGILLAVDLVKYADNRAVRAEKIRAFAYLGLGLLMAGIVNTCVGVITGLFG